MKNLLINSKFLITIFIILFCLSSCNNEELYAVEESILTEEEVPVEEEVLDVFEAVEAVNDTIRTSQNKTIDFKPYLNDINLPQNVLVSNTTPTNGSITINDNATPNDFTDDTVEYIPNTDFSGTDVFEYEICDADNDANCDSAIVNIIVNPVIEDDIATELKAFPTAEGAGANATGGRGGFVYHVTNLNDNGLGSLRYGIENQKTTPRTIVFDVSGTIVMNSPFDVSGIENLTIAGQSAPRGGITIQTPRFAISRANNIIIRYIRFVNTQYFYDQTKSATFSASGSNNIILDHVSMRYSWASIGFSVQDDNDQNDGQDDVTLQRSIIADNHTGGLVGAIAVDDNRIVLANKNSIHHNLFAHVDHRFPNVSGNAKAEIIENVTYNYRARLNTFFNDSESNVINNTYKGGPSSNFITGGRMKIGEYLSDNSSISYTTPKVYTSGNRITDNYTNVLPTDTSWNDLMIVWKSSGDATITALDEALYRSNTEFASLGVQITRLGTDAAYTSVLNDVGANKYLNADGTYGTYLDTNDTNYIADVANGTCWSCQPDGSLPDKTDISQLNYPILPENTRPTGYDTDRDGMPNVWEELKGFDPMIDDSSGDNDNDGYTNIEEFINLVDLNK